MKRLYRSRDNRVIAGVCGGVSEYFSIDPVLVRVIWIASIFIGAAGLMLYATAWVIMPEMRREGELPKSRGSMLIYLGAVLIAIGLLGVWESHWLLSGFSFFEFLGMIPGLMLALTGLGLILFAFFRPEVPPARFPQEESASGETTKTPRSNRRLLRSRRYRQIAGICGGLAVYFDVDPTLIRLAFLGVMFISGGLALLLYLILLFVVPSEPSREALHGGF